MAVTYGAFDYAGNNGMQVGIEVTWSAVTNTSTTTTATYKLYTNNQYTYSDNGEVLAFSVKNGGTTVDSGSITFNNTSLTGAGGVLRSTQTYTYTYSSSSYGTSPVSLGFAAAVSGTYNGSAPTVGLAVAVPARPIAAPAAPTLTATTASSSQINLSWNAPDDNGGAITSYTLQASSTSSTSGFVTIGPVGTALSYNYTGLTKYNQYWFKVLATNSAGSSAYSTVVTATTSATIPGVPTSFVATPSVNSVALNWVAPADIGGIGLDLANDYIVKRDGTTLAFTGSGTAFTDTGVTPATAYTYTVAAVNSIGTGTAASLSTTTIGGIARIWNGSSWVTTLPKVWNGTTWVDAQARMWNGTEWKYGI
jgi:hypothetical protein